MAKSPTWSRILSRPISRCASVPTNFSLTPSSGLASNLSGSGSMPLVKNGKITNDAFVHVADDAAIPADGAVLISAARFLENAEALSQRVGRTGVIWPNNHDLDDLVPYLDRLAVVALVFPTLRDGRAYSQARLLRDQFVFMLRAGFDTFEVKKESDAAAFASTSRRYSVFYQPTGDGRVTALHRRMQLRHSESASP